MHAHGCSTRHRRGAPIPNPLAPPQENKPAEKRKPDYEVYEEDDEFEELAQDNWDAAAEDEPTRPGLNPNGISVNLE